LQRPAIGSPPRLPAPRSIQGTVALGDLDVHARSDQSG
jgi:hypothetical protein